MKYSLIGLIYVYQQLPLKCHYNCRFNPTCSVYMTDCLIKYGFIKGFIKGIKRILRCNPFNKNYGYDPVKGE